MDENTPADLMRYANTYAPFYLRPTISHRSWACAWLDHARSTACRRRCWVNCARVATRVRSFRVTTHWP